jgi:peptide/nickel transport system ATP-binding protein
VEVSHLSIDVHLSHNTTQRALHDITLQISPGEVVGLVGESGSGKSTLALAMAGLLPPNARVATGSILFRGDDLTQPGDDRIGVISGDQIALIPQESSAALNPGMRVADQLSEVLRLHCDWSRDERREAVDRILRAVGLPEIGRAMSKCTRELSRSQQQRVAIAQALVCRPALLIADEPISARAAATQTEVLACLRRTRALLGTAVLVITHNPAKLAGWVQRVLVLHEGEVVEETSVARFMERSERVFTRAVMASVSAIPAGGRPAPADSGHRRSPLVAKGLYKKYSKRSVFEYILRGRNVECVEALNGASLALREGSTIALVGGPDSGKSTLARCLAAEEQPDCGDIWLEGRELSSQPTGEVGRRLRKVQLLVEPTAAVFNPRFSLEETVAEPLKLRGLPTVVRRAQASALIDRVGLPVAWREYRAAELNAGQRQRLALARAIAADPKVLILDEALWGLDLPVQAQMVHLLLELQATLSLACLFITHDLRLAGYIADEIAVMEGGRIVDYGSPSEVFSYPRHACTQALLDSVLGIEADSWDSSMA